MATAPVTTGAPTRARSNVTKLPTAAARKVQQPTARRRFQAIEAGAAIRLPSDYMSSIERKQAEDREIFASLQRTPELLLAMALLRAVDPMTRASALGTCIGTKLRFPDCAVSRQALAITRVISSESPAEGRA